MSLILDALRKSDHQHSERRAPDIARAGESKPRQGSPRWVWPVTALLVFNAAVLTWVLFAREPAPVATQNTTTATAQPAPTLSEPLVRETAVRAEVRSLLAETIDDARADRNAASESPPPSTASQTALTQQSNRSEPSSAIPIYDPVKASNEWQLPVLQLELHVYTVDPASRFGFINSQKVVEGTSIKEGPRVLEITQQGIILQYRSQRFQLTP